MRSEQARLCERITQTLATAPVHDHLGYEALAHLKLPGPPYLAIMGMLHRCLQPKLYVEIGVRRGDSLNVALPETQCVGIDPLPQVEPRSNLLLGVATSDDFFAVEKNRERCQGFDLALIDGDHSFEQAFKDFQNLESLAKRSSLICLHDVIPMDLRTAQPKPDGVSFHTGDVWRLMASIVANRKDLVAFTVATPPTGLGIVGSFGRYDKPLILPKWIGPLPTDWDEQARILNIVENRPETILAAFGGKP